jgi:hypothetical protein
MTTSQVPAGLPGDGKLSRCATGTTTSRTTPPDNPDRVNTPASPRTPPRPASRLALAKRCRCPVLAHTGRAAPPGQDTVDRSRLSPAHRETHPQLGRRGTGLIMLICQPRIVGDVRIALAAFVRRRSSPQPARAASARAAFDRADD